MDEWSGPACLQRYRELAVARLRLSDDSPSGGYQVLRDAAAIDAAQNTAARERARCALSTHDLRVGVLADDPYLLVLREAVRFPDGRLGLYNRLSVPSGVVVAPLIDTSVVLIQRFRHGTRRWHYEFPRGIVEMNENPEAAARRELIEEIGTKPFELVPIGDLHSSSGITDEYNNLFVARLIGLGQPDRHEAIARIDVVEQQDFRRMITKGLITDGPTLATYAQAQVRGLLA